MISLSLDRINAKSPYRVVENGGDMNSAQKMEYYIAYVSYKKTQSEDATLINLPSPKLTMYVQHMIPTSVR